VNIIGIEGIGEVYSKKLEDVGINTVDKLLKEGATRKGRDDLAEKTGISGALLLKWVNHADLIRIVGVAERFSELLEAAGVDSVPELAQRVAAHLHAKLVEVNAAKSLTRRIPTEKQIGEWIEQCKNLERVVHH